MKTLRETHQEKKQEKEQALINLRIEDMLAVLEQRNKLIAEYYRRIAGQGERIAKTGTKQQHEPVSV